jgi:hypothetical protein
MADDYGYTDEFGQEIIPPGTRINGVPTATAAPTPGSGDWTTISKGGPIAIRTPNSSTGQPAVQSPSASQFQPPATQTRPGLLTPNSSTGAPRYQVPTVNPMTLPVGGGLMTGVGGLTAFPTPTPERMTETLNNPPLKNDPWLVHTLFPGIFGPAPGAQTAPAAGAPSPATSSVTASGPSTLPQARGVSPPPPDITLPPFNVPPPPGNLPPFVRGPIPFNMPQRGAAPRAPKGYNLGYGGAGSPAATAPPAQPSSWFTGIDRPNADIVGGPTRPGYLSADPHEPGGPARMGALDLSGLFNHPAVAQAAAAHPAVQGALAQQGGGWQSAVGAPNMNNAMLGTQLQNAGINTGGRGARAAVPPRRPTAGGFGFNPQTQSPFGYGP